MTKKQLHNYWLQELDKELIKLGGKLNIEYMGGSPPRANYVFQTKVGELVLHPDVPFRLVPKQRLTYYLTLFGRFDKEKEAKKLVDCNPFSGKWNFHYGEVENTKDAEMDKPLIDNTIFDIVRQIKKVLN